jgi:nicotinamidase-related amidase
MSDFKSSALVLIDLQNDFMAPSATFAIDQESLHLLTLTIPRIVSQLRALGVQIIWIQSNYPPATKEWKKEVAESAQGEANYFANQSSSPTSQADGIGVQSEKPGDVPSKEEWVVEGTHLGKKPCCLAGTPNAELADWVALLKQPEDPVVIKTFYSAFKRTTLRQVLEERGLEKIYLAGLLSNMCVLATALDAVVKQKGLEVSVITDCLGWRRDISHKLALDIMQKYGIRLMSVDELLENTTSTAEEVSS